MRSNLRSKKTSAQEKLGFFCYFHSVLYLEYPFKQRTLDNETAEQVFHYEDIESLLLLISGNLLIKTSYYCLT